eukprot:1161112-Pelagomonas_calceolata.AAC.5
MSVGCKHRSSMLNAGMQHVKAWLLLKLGAPLQLHASVQLHVALQLRVLYCCSLSAMVQLMPLFFQKAGARSRGPQQVAAFGTVILHNAELGEHGGAACDDAMHTHEAIQWALGSVSFPLYGAQTTAQRVKAKWPCPPQQAGALNRGKALKVKLSKSIQPHSLLAVTYVRCCATEDKAAGCGVSGHSGRFPKSTQHQKREAWQESPWCNAPQNPRACLIQAAPRRGQGPQHKIPII